MISKKAQGLSSPEHIHHSRVTGQTGESAFKAALARLAIKYTEASHVENTRHHIDLFVNGKGIDVKGLKKSHKEGFVIVEFKNVQGKDGWCSEGAKAEYIAFQFPDCFYVVRRIELLEYCRTLLPMVTYEGKFNASKCVHKLYTRKGRKDLMTVIEKKELEGLAYFKKLS